MQKIIGFFKKIISKIENKFLFSICLLVFIHSCFAFLSLFKYTLSKTAYICGIFYFIPVIITFILYRCSNFLFKNASKITRVITTIISAIIMLVVYLCFILIVCFSYSNYADKVYTDINEYTLAKKTIVNKKEIVHFPSIIPQDAKDIQFYKSADWFSGSETIYLSYKTSRENIDNELKKHNFILTEGPYEEDYRYDLTRYLSLEKINLNQAGFKFYAIGQNTKGEYGIAVNDKTNRILYYSILLD